VPGMKLLSSILKALRFKKPEPQRKLKPPLPHPDQVRLYRRIGRLYDKIRQTKTRFSLPERTRRNTIEALEREIYQISYKLRQHGNVVPEDPAELEQVAKSFTGK
jgi:hypothetical protein